MSAAPALTPEAAIVLGLAATAMPFSGSPADQAEHWLRMLRVHGESGVALTALGVSEEPLVEIPDRGLAGPRALATAGGQEAVARVGERAAVIARGQGSSSINTGHVLLAAMAVYARDFEQVLEAHGTDRAEVCERLSGLVAPSETSS